MRNYLILFVILVCGCTAVEETPTDGPYVDSVTYVDAAIDATDASADANVDAGATWIPPDDVCAAAGVACVAGWCGVVYTQTDGGLGCRCDPCPVSDGGV